MADYSVTIDLADAKRGDVWNGIPSIGPVTINGAQPTAELERVIMWFRYPTGATLRLDSDPTATRDAPISIDNATTWEASIAAVDEFFPNAGTWSWDMEFHSDLGVLTLYEGQITVHPDITNS